MGQIVAYYRVSTQRQKKSGLGLAAQKQMAEQYANNNAKDGGTIIAEYTEAESGKNSNRPEIAKAIAHTKSCGGILFIACLDRLARNVHFISGLMESGVEFVCGDMPCATRFTIHILAAVAEEEGRRISERTRKGLEQAKKKGVKLGSNNEKWKASNKGRLISPRATKIASKTRVEEARVFYSFLMSTIKEKHIRGYTLQQIADDLNGQGHLTRALRPYTQATICRLLKRYG